jgi:hypothetical protein
MSLIGLFGLILIVPEAHGAPAREVPPNLARERARATPSQGRAGTPQRPIPRQRLLLTNRTVTRQTPSGDYQGVTPGLPTMPRIRLPRNAKKRCYLTWTGFQLLPTGSRLFLQFNKRPKVRKTVKGAALTLELSGCRVANWNNTRPLYTRYFPTPVRYARVRRRGKSTRMTVLLKKPVTASTRVVRLQGWYYLFITFRHTRARWADRTPATGHRTRRPNRSKRSKQPKRKSPGRRGPRP